MAIRLKNRTIRGGRAAVLVILVLAAVAMALYPAYIKAGKDRIASSYQDADYLYQVVSPALDGNYVLYNKISRETEESRLLETQELDGFRKMENYADYVLCDGEGKVLLSSGDQAEQKLQGSGGAEYAIFLRFLFDSTGKVSDIQVESSYLEANDAYALEEQLVDGQDYIEREWSLIQSQDYSSRGKYSPREISSPKEMMVLYGITRENLDACVEGMWQIDGESAEYRHAGSIAESDAFFWGMFALTVLAAAAGLVLPLQEKTRARVLFKAPVELLVVAACSAISVTWQMCGMIWKTWEGDLLEQAAGISREAQGIWSYLLNYLAWCAMFAVIYWIGACARDLFVMKKEYWKRRSIILGSFFWLAGCVKKTGRRVRDFWEKQYDVLLHFDFQDKTNRMILKVVGLNFVVLFLITFFWVFGVGVLIVYSVLLFLFLRKYIDRVQEQYKGILKTTTSLAAGRLDVVIDGDAGIFAPVQEELKKIQAGFQKAVKKETQSERMKSELITNVSHDLKTPLTAIITYVDLLKSEHDEEKKREYIEILDAKSQRLKVLIEDLFEISKAASRSVTLHCVTLDLVNLLKQVELEYDRTLKGAGLEVKWSVPEEKVLVNLDGEKAYRIFENLFVNISKYALANTRVYLDVEDLGDRVGVQIKNVSATELDFDVEEITDRFVRGDASRNTEGSGLGLAIAKSFTELMGGTLKISTEADLFRVSIQFPKA